MADISLSILGPSSLTAPQLQAWYTANHHGQGKLVGATVGEVIGWYVTEGVAQGVRGDVAFAQACIETGYFTSADTALNNFAGIAHPSGAPSGSPFASPQIGVRAQIQLLAKVVGGNSVALAFPNVAPGWGGRIVSTWGGLTGNWAQNLVYGNVIIALYNTMLGANPVLSGNSSTSAKIAGEKIVAATPVPPVPTATLPGVDLNKTLTPILTGADVTWPFNGNGDLLAEAVTTDSTVDLTMNQLPQIQLTIVDPTLALTAAIPGAINPLMAPSQTTHVAPVPSPTAPATISPVENLDFLGETMTVAEAQTTDTSGIPAMILTLRSSVLCWMASLRRQRTATGQSATDWIQSLVAEFNSLLPADATPVSFLGDVSAARPPIDSNVTAAAVTEWQSEYAIAQQMATEEGFWLWETNNGVFFGKPTWIALVAPSLKVGWPGSISPQGDVDVEALSMPVCLRSRQLFTGDTVQLTLPHPIGEQVRPGLVVHLSGVPYFSANPYIVTRVQWNFDGWEQPVKLTCNQVVDPVPTEPGGQSPNPPTSDPAGNPPQGTAEQFVQIAQQEIGVKYLWGGATPKGFDCSGLVMWDLNQMGIPFPHFTGSQYALCKAEGGDIPVALAFLTRGALLFRNAGSVVAGEHVAISMGDGVNILQAPHTGAFIEIVKSSPKDFDVAAKIPALRYSSTGSTAALPRAF